MPKKIKKTSKKKTKVNSGDHKVSQVLPAVHKAAVLSRENSYSPYSKFKVGAALLTDSGIIFSGCNVENASYGGTICAERTALFKAVSEGQKRFTDLVVVTAGKNPVGPCALCLQALAEFCTAEMRVWFANEKKITQVFEFCELLPRPFGPSQLKVSRRK